MNYDADNPHDPRFYNIILEEEALQFEPCQDINKTVSNIFSKVEYEAGFSRSFHLGEQIKATVTLHDGYRRRKYSGGDQLRATIENKTLKASAPCIVTDNKDGTHTVICEALWSGASSIFVTLAYTRETITSIYRVRTQLLATRILHGKFKSRNYEEDVVCHPNSTHLLKLTNYTELCNMTYANSGMPFYCGKPNNEHLLCQDWEQIRNHLPYPELPLTECEETLLNRGQRTLKQNLQVDVKSKEGYSSVSLIDKPSLPCSAYNISLLWHTRKPSGYFYKGTWTLRHCLGVTENYMGCLKNRRIYLFGDSTLRAWYVNIVKRFRCKPVTEKWEREKWHKEAECYNKEINLYSGWYPHSQPFNVGNAWDDVRYTLYSVSRRLDNIPRETHSIIIIQLFMHFVAFHHDVFRERMTIIRKTVENFLNQSSHSIVMLKAPHTFEGTPAGGQRLSDYYGFVYSRILFEVFNGLHDRVVLLNNRDTTLAQHVRWNHPNENIVNAMVNQMLDYACKK